MTLPRSRAARLAAALLFTPAALAPMWAAPAQAQWIVYDPTNYVQNVLTAARSLQRDCQESCVRGGLTIMS